MSKGTGRPKLMDRLLAAAMAAGVSIKELINAKAAATVASAGHLKQSSSERTQASKHRVAMDKRAALKRRNVQMERARHRG